MVASVCKQLGSLELYPSSITLRARDGHPSNPLSLYHNYPITVARKTVCIDIQVIDAPLDYNILLGRSYTYAMSIVTSVVHCKMCITHNGKIVTIGQLTYYDPKS